MNGIEQLFIKNYIYLKPKPVIVEKTIVIRFFDERIGHKTVVKLISYLKDFHEKRLNSFGLPIKIELHSPTIDDKLTYVLLECVLWYAIVHYKYRISIALFIENINVQTLGIKCSVLNMLSAPECGKEKQYLQKFRFEIYRNHYRRVIYSDNNKNTGASSLSWIFGDIISFQNNYKISNDYQTEIAEVVVELIGNAIEHTHSDCLIDIDIVPRVVKRDNKGEYYCINIAVINFSNYLFGYPLKQRMVAENNQGERIKDVIAAYDMHRKLFDSNYSEDDFYMIAAFQHKVSSRMDTLTGGTGLTKLIRSLEEKSEAYSCYMQSGTRQIYFYRNYLEYNNDGWIGFNETNSFLYQAPDRKVLGRGVIDIPGTMFNLSFIVKVEE